MLICIGDSITYGRIGVSYTKYLNRKVINKGVNGDTVAGMTVRLKKLLKSEKYSDVPDFVVAIGTNDILLPTLKKCSPLWRVFIPMMNRVEGKVVSEDIEEFCARYEEMLTLLAGKKVILLGIPKMETKKCAINEEIRERNARLAELAQKYGMRYIDTYALMDDIKAEQEGDYFYEKTNFMRIVDAVLMTLFPFTKDPIAKSRGLKITVDGVHHNSASAKAIANAVNDALQTL